MELSVDELLEFRKCYEDPEYFVRQYLGDEYTSLVEPIVGEHRLLVKNATMDDHYSVLAYMVWRLVFHRDQTMIVISDDVYARDSIFCLFCSLPKYMQPKVMRANKSWIELDNGMRVLVSHLMHRCRGHAISFFYGDDFANWGNDAQTMWNNYMPTISMTGKVILTDRKPNPFYALWDNSTSFGKVG